MTHIAQTLPTCAGELKDFTVLQASGADVFDFLQGQFTQDLKKCTENRALVAAWCNPKGRVLANFLVWKVATPEPSYYLLMQADIVQAVLKRLRMYVLRAKVVFTQLQSPVFGVISHAPLAAAETLNSEHNIQVLDQHQLIQVSALEDTKAYVLIDSANTGAEQSAAVAQQLGVPLTEDAQQFSQYWNAVQIFSGIAWIKQSNTEKFLVQSLNYDALGAVNFRKGCYPGQEVVARSHYKGNLKRRAIIGVSPGLEAPASNDIFTANTNDPCGEIINIAQLAESEQTITLFEIRLDALETANLKLGAADGPAIEWQRPPYSLEKPEV
ncbi:YgfZ/GcvT domain-containing protein [Brackiella oedipodis]|uniref:CAF17-like 4Fe-4S cluster assembly/insertion protein YgfZ n=1 Tax=Brackiella oedipodis TaxID=124225 RepID=UPI000685C710|nr:folate-binding protein YgfZ [Brackiella oedipodis]